MYRQHNIAINLIRSLSRLSYFHKVGDYALQSITAGKLLKETAQKYKDRKAVISCHQNKEITFTQLHETVDKFAVGLKKLDVKLGDTVAIWSPNCLEWIISALACARLGCPLVQLNHSYTKNELFYSLNKTKTKTLICGHASKYQNYYEIIKEIDPNIFNNGNRIQSKHLSSLRSVITMDENRAGTYHFEELQKDHTLEEIESIEERQNDISFDDTLNVQFTSGSTGNPKAAVLSHFNMINNSYAFGYRMKLNEKHHTICVPLPLFHTFGTTAALYTCINFGSTLILPTGFYDPAKTLQSIRDNHCTVIYGSPTMYIDLIEQQKHHKFDLPIEIVCTGSSPGSPKLIQDIYKYIGCKSVVNVYGLTEATAIVFQSYLESAMFDIEKKVGIVFDHLEVKVVDEENKLVEFGTMGELCVRGYSIMREYMDDPEKSKDTVDAHGWLRTGDKFILNEDGSGKIVGRIKDIIIRGGENIYPKEIEDYLCTHPHLIDCQVVGLPHERLGEEVCACIRLKDGKSLTLQEVIDFCKNELAHYKIPSKLYIFKEYPKTTNGKVQKFRIIDELKSRM